MPEHRTIIYNLQELSEFQEANSQWIFFRIVKYETSIG